MASAWVALRNSSSSGRRTEADGIRSNAVDPGSMRTEMRAEAYPEEDPGQVPTPAEVADIFVWLASDRSADVTGQRCRAKEFDAGVS